MKRVDGLAPPFRARLWRLAKWAWLLTMVAAGILLLRRHSDQVSIYIGSLASWQVALCLASLVAGKILLSRSAADAVAAQGLAMPFLTVFSFVSLSQLGKYIPGGIWHFLGRGGLYTSFGMDVRTVTKALLLENVWQWLAALLIGIALVLPFRTRLGGTFGQPMVLASICIVVSLLFWYVVNGWCFRRLTTGARDRRVNATRALAIQIAAWLCFGIGLWSLFPITPSVGGLALGVGAFAIAAFAGFIVPVAPAGLGVREAALAAALLPLLTTEQAAICAGLNRVAWLVVELSLAGTSQLSGLGSRRAGIGG